MLLIITNTTDIGSDYIVHRLHQRRQDFTRLNTDEYPIRFDVQLRASNNSTTFSIRFRDGRIIWPSDVSSVIFRRPVTPKRSNDILAEDADFVERELLEALRSLWRSIPERLWLNHPNNLWLARNKFEQLLRAVRFGFTIPDTLITCEPDEIRKFGKHVGWPIIGKAVKHGFVCNEHIARLGTTKRIDEDDIPELERSARSPLILQKLVPKQSDLRITVVGDQVFSAAIASQVRKETAIDWRAMHAVPECDLEHSDHYLPIKLQHQCIALTRSYGLRFAAIDLALTPKGEYVFFELNPNGEWVWIEERIGHPISDAIIDLMLTGESMQ